MERILKSFCILMVVFFVAITVGSVTEQDVYAGGGINYKVTVRNPTELKCQVRVWVHKFDHSSALERVTLQPNQSHTWETGALCPDGLTGKIYSEVDKAWFKMQETNMYGNAQDPSVWPATCWSSTLEVCRKVGTGYANVRDNDYGFCK